ncbi:MAG: Lrp/AsnC family transcriptional regulator [Candidatus Aenigmarchaeota archaeon]|nr:Lrp/AsnC family transcriptional regulator [Candidatus Aenigmarchaeota archaeon]
MTIKLDVKDRKILYELDKDARQSVSKIAKKVGLSTDAVNYRIKQLVKNKAIFKFMALMDTAKLGFTTYKIFYRFQNTTIEKENEIIKYLVDRQRTQYITTTEGLFDLNVNILSSSVKDLETILVEITKKFGQYIAERQVNIIVEAFFFFRDYFIEKKKSEIRKPMYFGSENKEIKIDEKDKLILKELGNDARISAVDISKKAGLSSDAIIQRIRKLENSGIIQNYVLYPNSESFGNKSYFILLKFRDLEDEEERKFFTYCRLNPNIWFYAKMIGQWDCVIDIDVENDEEFKEILTNIKKDFSKILREYNIFKFTKTYKFNQYPF